MIGKAKSVWMEATWAFVASRVMILFFSLLGVYRFAMNGGPAAGCSLGVWGCAWFHFDTLSYIDIARYGYVQPLATVFFPLWPLSMHVFGLALQPFFTLDTAYYLAGLVLENAFFYFVLVLFYHMVRTDFDVSVARRSIFFLAFAPYGIFFFTAYTEAMFLFFCLATFVFLQRGKPLDWWLAALCAALATVTRSTGWTLGVAFLVVVLQRLWPYRHVLAQNWRTVLNVLVPMAIIPVGLIMYMIYLAHTKGNPLLFSTEEATFWQRKLEFPWVGIVDSIRYFFANPPGTAKFDASNLTDILFTLAALVVFIGGWKRLPLHYTLFTLVILLFSLCYPYGTQAALSAAPRYMMVIFPLFVILALWSKYPRFERLYTAVSVMFFALNILLFVTHNWVA